MVRVNGAIVHTYTVTVLAGHAGLSILERSSEHAIFCLCREPANHGKLAKELSFLGIPLARYLKEGTESTTSVAMTRTLNIFS